MMKNGNVDLMGTDQFHLSVPHAIGIINNTIASQSDDYAFQSF